MLVSWIVYLQGKSDPKTEQALKAAQEKLQDLRKENAELKQQIRQLESKVGRGGDAASDVRE